MRTSPAACISLDPAIAQTRGNPVLWQTLLGAELSVATVTLQLGKTYVAAVGISNLLHQRSAFGSRRFTP